MIHIIESCVYSDLLPPGWSAAFKGGIPLQSVDWLSSDWKVTEGLILTCAGRRDLSKFTRMSMIQRMNAAKNLRNVDPKILMKVNCSMTTHLLVLSSNPAILHRRGFTPVSTVLRKSVRKGDLQGLKSDKFPGGGEGRACPRTPLEACAFSAPLEIGQYLS